MPHPAIVLVAFGTAHLTAQRVYSHIESQARERFPAHTIRWGLTSSTVRRRLREHGLTATSPAEALAELHAQGHRRIAVQSLHIGPGQEYSHVEQLPPPEGTRLAIGTPLLASAEDYDAVIAALAPELETARPTLLVAHGNNTYPQFNLPHLELGARLIARYPHVTLASLEGQPGSAPLAAFRPAVQQAGSVHLIPLLLVDGGHVHHDLMGHQPTAWRQQLGAAEATCAPPLGLNDAILAIYWQHLERALATL